MLKGDFRKELQACAIAERVGGELAAYAHAECKRLHDECSTAAEVKEAQAALLAHVKSVKAQAEAEARAAKRATAEEVAADRAARASAREFGARHYVGKACPHCGSKTRLVSTGQCGPCNAEKMNEWRRTNGRN